MGTLSHHAPGHRLRATFACAAVAALAAAGDTAQARVTRIVIDATSAMIISDVLNPP
jgi:hypothetical protein